MFSLIITIISIALVVALVAATMYHGGDVLTEGRTEADAAAFVAGAQQISGAAAMYLALEGQAATGIDGAADSATLVGKSYLSSVPSIPNAEVGDAWALTASTVTAPVNSADVCTALADDNSDTYTCATDTFTFNY